MARDRAVDPAPGPRRAAHGIGEPLAVGADPARGRRHARGLARRPRRRGVGTIRSGHAAGDPAVAALRRHRDAGRVRSRTSRSSSSRRWCCGASRIPGCPRRSPTPTRAASPMPPSSASPAPATGRGLTSRCWASVWQASWHERHRRAPARACACARRTIDAPRITDARPPVARPCPGWPLGGARCDLRHRLAAHPRPRRPPLPRAAVRPAGLRPVEQRLVRRPPHPRLQRPVPGPVGGAHAPARRRPRRHRPRRRCSRCWPAATSARARGWVRSSSAPRPPSTSTPDAWHWPSASCPAWARSSRWTAAGRPRSAGARLCGRSVQPGGRALRRHRRSRPRARSSSSPTGACALRSRAPAPPPPRWLRSWRSPSPSRRVGPSRSPSARCCPFWSSAWRRCSSPRARR